MCKPEPCRGDEETAGFSPEQWELLAQLKRAYGPAGESLDLVEVVRRIWAT